MVKNPPANAGDVDLVPGSGSFPGEGNGNPLQYSGLENSIDCIVHRITKNQTQLSKFHRLECSEKYGTKDLVPSLHGK